MKRFKEASDDYEKAIELDTTKNSVYEKNRNKVM